jgi:hypothetical protein
MRGKTLRLGFAALLCAIGAAGCSDDDHPGPISSEETALVGYQSCEDLERDLRDMVLEEVEAHFDQERYWRTHPFPWLESDAGGPPRGDATADGASPGRQEGVDYSGTNNQEAGVDEADFVKTDGYHIYLINGNRLHVFGVPTFGALTPESVFELEGWPTEMLIDNESGRVAVFSHVDAYTLPPEHPLRARVGESDARGAFAYRVASIAKVTVIEAGNRRAPRLARELYLEGSYQTARLVERSVRLGAYTHLAIPSVDYWKYYWYGDTNLSIDEREAAAKQAARELALEDMVPRIYERLPDRTFSTIHLAGGNCSTFHRPTDSHGRGVTSLVTFDLGQPAAPIGSQQIVTNYSQLYASTDFLYLAEPAHDWWWFWWNPRVDDITNLHAFDISRPGETRYVGSGRVTGEINNSFSMSEHEGILRVATTTDRFARWWIDPEERPESENHVFTLRAEGGKLVKVGHLGGLAPGERVWSARFAGDRAFIVTFRNIDPLFAIDLSNPASPRVLDELKVPGVSTYIQPIDGDHLLTIGYGGDDDGLNWRGQVSLFDASDPTRLGLLDVEPLAGGRSYSWSEALYQHKAFQYWAPKRLLAVPVSSYGSASDGRDPSFWTYTSMLQLVSVGEDGLSTYGTIDHSGFYNSDLSQRWIYTDIRRSIFMGEFVYAISDRGITVHKLSDLSTVADEQLPGYIPNHYYWWW